MPIVKLVPGETLFFLCDVQTRIKSFIYGCEELIMTINKVLEVAKVLEIPVLATEQNTKAFGPTVPEIDLASLGSLHLGTFGKNLFSMVTPEVKFLLQHQSNVKSVVLFGIESHICVLQTALDLLALGYQVHVLADGVSSCNREEVPTALAQISQVGGIVTTSESALFQLQRDASSSTFKPFASVIKEEKENTKKVIETLLKPRNSL